MAQGRGGGLGRRGGDGQLEGEGRHGGAVAGEEVGEVVFQDVGVERLTRNEPARTNKIGIIVNLINDKNGLVARLCKRMHTK